MLVSMVLSVLDCILVGLVCILAEFYAIALVRKAGDGFSYQRGGGG